MTYQIVCADNPWVSPDPCGRFETMGEVGARIREDLDKREEYVVKEVERP